MENCIIKPIIRVGNSAGVVLPLEWYGGEARIELVKKPLNIKEEVLSIIDKYMESVLGVYLAGSYARGEEKENSDIDILVITSDLNKRIKKGKYDILLISLNEVRKGMKIIVPLVPIIHEAVPIINKQLIEELKKEKIKKENLKWHIETTKSSLKIIRGILDIEEGKIDGSVIYPLVLRLREAYIIDSLLKNKKYTSLGFLEMLKRKGIYELYEGYELVKRGKKAKLVDKKLGEKAYELIKEHLHEA
jgi:predicted nucleotidyltransferase